MTCWSIARISRSPRVPVPIRASRSACCGATGRAVRAFRAWAGAQAHGAARGLAGEDLVIRERGSVTREVFESALAERGVTPGTLIEVEGRESVREAVAAGFGLGIVFESEMPPGRISAPSPSAMPRWMSRNMSLAWARANRWRWSEASSILSPRSRPESMRKGRSRRPRAFRCNAEIMSRQLKIGMLHFASECETASGRPS